MVEAWRRLLGGGRTPGRTPQVSPVFAQACAGLLLGGCATPGATRLRCRVEEADTFEDLWALRPEVYDCIALALGEAEATRRLKRFDVLLAEASMPDSGLQGLRRDLAEEAFR